MPHLKNITILIILIISFNFSCTQEKVKHNQAIVGIYCGMCYDNCSIFFNVTQTTTFMDTTDSFFKLKNYDYFEKNNIEQNLTSQSEFIDLINSLPNDLSMYPKQIGCPDCLDQCGFLIKVGEKEIFIDPDNHPKEFKSFKDKLNQITSIYHSRLKDKRLK